MGEPSNSPSRQDPHWCDIAVALSREARAWFVRIVIALALIGGAVSDQAGALVTLLIKLAS